MEEKRKNLFQLLILLVIFIAILFYYGIQNIKDKEKSNTTHEISAEHTIIPMETENTDKIQLATPTDMPSATLENGISVSAKSDEYHNEIEGEQ